MDLNTTPHTFTKSLIIKEIPKFKSAYNLRINPNATGDDPNLFTTDDIQLIRNINFKDPLKVWTVYLNAEDLQPVVENVLYYDNVTGYYISSEPAKEVGEMYANYLFDPLPQLTATPLVIELLRELLDQAPSDPEMPLEVHLTYLLKQAVLDDKFPELKDLEKDLVDTSTLLVSIDPSLRPLFLDFIENEKLVPTSPWFNEMFKKTLDGYKEKNPKANLILEDLMFMLGETDPTGIEDFALFCNERIKKQNGNG